MSLGNTLYSARTARHITLNQAALETRIRQSVLEALEADDYTALPPRPFLRGLLRNYALYLNVDPDAALEEYDTATGHQAPSAPARIAVPPPQSSEPPAALPEQNSASTNFPPFEIVSAPEAERITEDLSTEAEPTFIVAPEPTPYVEEPTAPLNLSQEPQTLAQKIGSTRIPEIVAIVAIAVALFVLVSLGFNQLDRLNLPFIAFATPRPTITPSPTIRPGSTPTSIPTLPQTLAAVTPNVFTGARATTTPDARISTPTPVISATLTAPATAPMTLTIQANGPMEAWVIADESQVFNGALQNETHTWTARSRLFVQVKNITQGQVAFNNTRILPRNQQERSELARGWLMNPQGTPVAVPPTPFPAVVLPTLPATAAPSITPAPTQTVSPTWTPTWTMTATRTLTPTRTGTSEPTHTPTFTPTRTTTFTPTRAATRIPTLVPTITRAPIIASTR